MEMNHSRVVRDRLQTKDQRPQNVRASMEVLLGRMAELKGTKLADAVTLSGHAERLCRENNLSKLIQRLACSV